MFGARAIFASIVSGATGEIFQVRICGRYIYIHDPRFNLRMGLFLPAGKPIDEVDKIRWLRSLFPPSGNRNCMRKLCSGTDYFFPAIDEGGILNFSSVCSGVLFLEIILVDFLLLKGLILRESIKLISAFFPEHKKWQDTDNYPVRCIVSMSLRNLNFIQIFNLK